MTQTLAPDEKWRLEVDADYIHQLRLALGQPLSEFCRRSGVSVNALHNISTNRSATLPIIARLATYLQVQPGELIVWYPVPKEWPDRITEERFK